MASNSLRNWFGALSSKDYLMRQTLNASVGFFTSRGGALNSLSTSHKIENSVKDFTYLITVRFSNFFTKSDTWQ